MVAKVETVLKAIQKSLGPAFIEWVSDAAVIVSGPEIIQRARGTKYPLTSRERLGLIPAPPERLILSWYVSACGTRRYFRMEAAPGASGGELVDLVKLERQQVWQEALDDLLGGLLREIARPVRNAEGVAALKAARIPAGHNPRNQAPA